MNTISPNQVDHSSECLVLSKTRFFGWLRPAIQYAQQQSLEGPWYTVWNIVLLAVTLASGPKDSDHTLIAPQLPVVRHFPPTVGSDIPEYVRRVIPDFVLVWYWRYADGPKDLRRGIDLIVEIKPPSAHMKSVDEAEAASVTILASLDQVKLQIRHAFDECPRQNHLWALVICGLHWMIFKFQRGDMSPESKKKGPKTRSQTIAQHIAEMPPVDQAVGQQPPGVEVVDPTFLPEATYTSVTASDVHSLVDGLETDSPSISNAFRVMVDAVWKDQGTNMTAAKPAWLTPDSDSKDPDGSMACSKLLHVWLDHPTVEPSGKIVEDFDETSWTIGLSSNDDLIQQDAGRSKITALGSPLGLPAQDQGKKRPPPSPSPSPSRLKKPKFDLEDAIIVSSSLLTKQSEELQPQIPLNRPQPVVADEISMRPSVGTTSVSEALSICAGGASTSDLLLENQMLKAEVDKLQARLRVAGLSPGEFI